LKIKLVVLSKVTALIVLHCNTRNIYFFSFLLYRKQLAENNVDKIHTLELVTFATCHVGGTLDTTAS
ncbi:hypothetical protein, partial [Clostridium sp.]